MIKKKSLVVSLVSSIIICGVLVLTLVGYIAYLEIKNKDHACRYVEMLRKVNAKFYSKHIEISDLGALIEPDGPLKGKAIIKGSISNSGPRDMADILIKIGFRDMDGAPIYEVVFHPQEPALGSSSLAQVPIPYISTHPMAPVVAGSKLTFKKILANCPVEIAESIKDSGRGQATRQKWNGKLEAEILAVDLI